MPRHFAARDLLEFQYSSGTDPAVAVNPMAHKPFGDTHDAGDFGLCAAGLLQVGLQVHNLTLARLAPLVNSRAVPLRYRPALPWPHG